MSFGIFLMRQHIAPAFPTSCSTRPGSTAPRSCAIFLRIIVPLCSSAISAIGIFAFIQAWSAFIWPLP